MSLSSSSLNAFARSASCPSLSSFVICFSSASSELSASLILPGPSIEVGTGFSPSDGVLSASLTASSLSTSCLMASSDSAPSSLPEDSDGSADLAFNSNLARTLLM
uniref:Putative secreted peptide n=1 Tax=Anopheles braziliensis TaxID=58242 RepID=A0A2M3ZTF4_9DIPT